MGDKKTHFGRAGEYFAMSELLLRGWNVAVPVVDVGDDAFVIDDRDKTTRRVQVKTAACAPVGAKGSRAGRVRAAFKLSRTQLRTRQPIELFYMLMMRLPDRWRFLIIPRETLHEVRLAYLQGAATRSARGRQPLGDADATSDTLRIDVEIEADTATGWGASLGAHLDQWPEALGVVTGGPGSTGTSDAPDATLPSEGGPSPSRGRGR